jgi:hypothetical protein
MRAVCTRPGVAGGVAGLDAAWGILTRVRGYLVGGWGDRGRRPRWVLAGHTDAEIADELEDDITQPRVTQVRINLLLQQEINRILDESRPDYVAIRDNASRGCP